MTDVVGMSQVQSLALLYFFVVLQMALSDLFMGSVIDNTNTKMGKAKAMGLLDSTDI
jgi:Na+/melibiose symporter-like transporter